MNPIYRLLSVIHKWLLLTIVVLLFIAKFIVGSAGHSSDFSSTDFLLFAYLIVTAILLSVVQYAPKNETTFSKIIRFTTILFLVVGVITGVQAFFENVSDSDSLMSEMLFLIFNALFIFSGSILCFGLIKHSLRKFK